MTERTIIMGSNDANRELIEKGYTAFGAGDLATLEQLFHPDVVWHEPGTSPVSGDYKGWAELSGLFISYAQRSGGTFKAELQDVLASAGRAFSVARVTGDHDGRRIDQTDHVLFDIDGNGRVTEARVFYHDQNAIDAFWA